MLGHSPEPVVSIATSNIQLLYRYGTDILRPRPVQCAAPRRDYGVIALRQEIQIYQSNEEVCATAKDHEARHFNSGVTSRHAEVSGQQVSLEMPCAWPRRRHATARQRRNTQP